MTHIKKPGVGRRLGTVGFFSKGAMGQVMRHSTLERVWVWELLRSLRGCLTMGKAKVMRIVIPSATAIHTPPAGIWWNQTTPRSVGTPSLQTQSQCPERVFAFPFLALCLQHFGTRSHKKEGTASKTKISSPPTILRKMTRKLGHLDWDVVRALIPGGKVEWILQALKKWLH